MTMNKEGYEAAQKIRKAFDDVTHLAKDLATDPGKYGLDADDRKAAADLYEHLGQARDRSADLADRDEP